MKYTYMYEMNGKRSTTNFSHYSGILIFGHYRLDSTLQYACMLMLPGSTTLRNAQYSRDELYTACCYIKCMYM